ncbi:hypothetical protein B566_EDAN017073, partial [Ephemera danica]
MFIMAKLIYGMELRTENDTSVEYDIYDEQSSERFLLGGVLRV